MPHRIDVKVSTKNDYWFTGFNGTLEEAREYFIGYTFHRHDDIEPPSTIIDLPVVSVELVKE